MSVRAIKTYEYHAPETLDEVKALLAQYGSGAKILAGGTDLVPKMKAHIFCPDHVISLKNIESLKKVDCSKEKGLYFGANVKLHEMQLMDFVKEDFTALHNGICGMSSTQIRNMSTVVGNICNAVPSADTAPGLIVLGAKVKIEGPDGERWVLIEDFITGVLKTVLKPEEIVTQVYIPALPENSASAYIKFSQRNALDLAMVGSAAWIQMRESKKLYL